MTAVAGTIAFFLSIALYAAAFGITVRVGVQRLITAKREKRSALAAPLANRMERRDYVRLFWYLLLSTALVYVVGVSTVLGNAGKSLSLHDAFLWAFQKNDALHYMEIAKYGYTAAGPTRYFIVFFPLFPLLVHAVSVFTFGHYIAAAVLLNFVLMYVAVVAIFKMGIMDFPRDSVYAAIGFLLLFPMAFFFHNAYTEPLFLATSSLSLYCTRRDRYALSGLFGCLCALSRASGVLCAVPLVARSFIAAWETGKFRPFQWLKKAAWSAVILAGTGFYLVLNYVVTGDALMFLKIESEHWFNGFRLFPSAVQAVTQGMLGNTFAAHVPFWVSQFIAVFLFLVVLILGARRLPTELSFYNLAYYFLMISQSWLLSGPRYLMAMFPAYFAMALTIRSKTARIAVLALSGVLLAWMTALFASGYCLY